MAADDAVEVGWHLIVDPACDGWRVDRFLALRLTRVSRARAARLAVIDEDDRARGPLKKSAAVRKGQRLFVERPLPDAGVSLPPPTILHADDDLLVLDKPAGWAAHPTATRYAGTLKYWLATEGYDAEHEPVHRLDVETSGVIAIARTAAAARFYKMALENRAFEKTYLCVVEGEAPAAFTVDVPLGFDPDTALKLALKMGRGTLPAETGFERLWTDGRRSVLVARPITGRQHQIRVHAALSGLPLVGDKLYGPDEQLFLASLERALTDEELARLGHPRQALHAWRLALPSPSGEVRVFEAPWPAELACLAPGFTPD